MGYKGEFDDALLSFEGQPETRRIIADIGVRQKCIFDLEEKCKGVSAAYSLEPQRKCKMANGELHNTSFCFLYCL